MKKNNRLIRVSGPLLTMFCVSILFSLLNTILVLIQKEFSASLLQLQWMINIFGIFMCSSLVIMGRLADYYGRKHLYVIASVVLATSFIGICFSKNPGMIIFFQAFSGLSTAIFLTTTQSIMLQYYPGKETSHGMAIWAGVVAIALGIGPIMGGVFSDFIGWRSAFFILAILVFIGMVLTVFNVEDNLKKTESKKLKKLDSIGAFLLWITITSLVVAIVEMHYLSNLMIAILFIIFITTLLSLIIHEIKNPEPILLFSLFKNNSFLKAASANGFTMFYVWAAFFLLPYYLQTVQKVSALYAGIDMLFVSIPLTIMSFFIGNLYKRVGHKPLLGAGFILMAIAALIQTQMNPHWPVIIFLISCLCFGFGWGFTWSVSMTAAMESVPENEIGVSSGTFLTFQEIGGTVGLAVVVTVVRWNPQFMLGYQNAMWILTIISIVSFFLAINIKKKVPDEIQDLKEIQKEVF